MSLIWFLFLLVFLVSALLVLLVLKRKRFDMVGGVAVGYAYFIGGPAFQALLFGQVKSQNVFIRPVNMQDSTDLGLLLLISGLATLMLLLLPRRSIKSGLGGLVERANFNKGYLRFHLIAYVTLALSLFVLSGKAEGGHWMENNAEMYGQGFLPSILGNFYNVLRCTVPAVVLYFFKDRAIGYKYGMLILGVFCLFEMIVSSNRILILFSLISMVIMTFSFQKRYLVVFLLAAPLVLQVNSFFPVFRGLLWSQGATWSSVSRALEVSMEAREELTDGIEKILNPAFESINVVVIQNVIDDYGTRKPFLYGETMFLKSATFFLPKAIFPMKPEGFNLRIGLDVGGLKGLALNATLIGESFGNFGWFGTVFYMLFLVLAYWASKLFGGGLPDYMFFFIAIAAWRFEFSFFVISLFVLSVIFAVSSTVGRKTWRLSGRRVSV